MKKATPSQLTQNSPRSNQVLKDAIDVGFYAAQRLPRLFSTVLGILGLLWFGSTCFKLGWVARDNFFLRPIAEVIFGLESSENKEESIFKSLEDLFSN